MPGARYLSARGAALGDAMLPWGDDGASGLFYNPASLGKIRNTKLDYRAARISRDEYERKIRSIKLRYAGRQY